MRQFLLIPHAVIHNANALSSPYTIGFPALTAWLGGVHALQRKLQQYYPQLSLFKTGISCHAFKLHTYKGKKDYVQSIIGTANPLDKNGARPTFIEEARCDLEVSLLVEYNGIEPDQQDQFLKHVQTILMTLKMASGDVVSVKNVERLSLDDRDAAKDLNILMRKLMLGYVLIERRDLMQQQQTDADTLKQLLDHLSIHHQAEIKKKANGLESVSWTSSRLTSGWIVPIAVGFQGISPLGSAKNQRDKNVLHRFAESVVTLGEFIMPYRVRQIDEVLWKYHTDEDKGLYLCLNNQSM